MNSSFFILNKNAYAKRIISKLRPCPPTLILNQNKSWIHRMATTRRIKPNRQIDIQYNSSKTQIRKQLKIGFFGTPYIYRESIKEPWHLWRPLHIENSVFVYSNSMWRWRQRCQGYLIHSRYYSTVTINKQSILFSWEYFIEEGGSENELAVD